MFEPVITSKFCKSLAISPTVCGRKESRRCQPGETISTATSSLQALPPGCSPIPRTQRGRMKLLAAVLLAAGLLSTAAGKEQPPRPDEPSKTCFFQTLSSVDSEFCRGDLEIIYPELGDVGCTYIPKCHQYRRRISKEWGSPRVRYPQAEESKKYVLVLVDPDAPSRANPRNRFWRHWLVTDIPGADLRTGDIQGRVLTAYVRPTPPPRSGYHRYQLRLYEQPAHEAIALSPEERVSLGAWAMENFVEQFRLGSPVASTQFLTKYHED
ncbi:phosphatidylethanolamine-binding protein 4 isoform X1 [Falco biarmicus]|uniref:phosphatidylethanolamine-binding protein 4 isoform X1 n=2 Tax=Falco cherrug TaxID=345164 RepID=UPI000FFB152B|nr:phosphatidylethanolamine-binding protein 4 isoform X1 [Falco cherrug]XP_056177737.1 phosphatidylethanolamine-binding protein 4 isoform X1 [Falco biarmicus]